MKKLEYIKPKDHDDWLKIRKNAIGGSDAASIVGLNKFSSPLSVWMDKTGRSEAKDSNEAMRQGTDLEEYVARRFTEATGKKVRRETRVIINPDYPFAHANIDRRIVGENAGLECKTTSALSLKKFKDGEFPENYYIQCLHYMMVTGMEKYYLAVLVLGKEFLWFEIPRNDEMIQFLIESEKDFWELVESDTPPEADGSESMDKALLELYPESDSTSIDLFGMDGKVKKLLKLKEKEKFIKKEISQLEQEFKKALGNSEIGETDNFRITWKSCERRNFQVKEFLKDNPEIDPSSYYKTSSYRKFTVKER